MNVVSASINVIIFVPTRLEAISVVARLGTSWMMISSSA